MATKRRKLRRDAVTVRLQVLVTKDEAKALRAVAMSSGATVSAWARAVLVRAAQGGYAPG